MEAAAVLKGLAYVAAGKALTSAGILRHSDGEVAVKFVSWFTAPSIILQSLCCQGRLATWTYPAFLAGMAYSASCLGLSWLLFRGRLARERAVLFGCAVGSSVTLLAFPFIELAFGTPGLHAAILFGLANSLAVYAVSFLSFSSAGPAAPENYVHEDGGKYRGQWEGLKKEGVGTYIYPSGAMYEGEWKDNQKSGRGIYTFPKGGLYEGEWLNGSREGVGIRTFSDGRVTAGRWQDNKLTADLDIWQCSRVVEGAMDAASAAKKVDVGGGTVAVALQQVALQPAVWAALMSIGINIMDLTLPPSVDALTRPLAGVHGPLALLSVGLTLEVLIPARRQVHSAIAVVGSRCMMAFTLCSGLFYFASAYNPVGVNLGAAVLIAALSPVSMQASNYARKFRLNEKLTGSLISMSTIVSLVLVPLVALACVTLRSKVRYSDIGLVMAKATASASIVALLAVVGLEVWLYPRKPVKMVFNASKLPVPGQEGDESVSDIQVYDGPNTQQGRGTQLPAVPFHCVRRYKKGAHHSALRWGVRRSLITRNVRLHTIGGKSGGGLARCIIP